MNLISALAMTHNQLWQTHEKNYAHTGEIQTDETIIKYANSNCCCWFMSLIFGCGPRLHPWSRSLPMMPKNKKKKRGLGFICLSEIIEPKLDVSNEEICERFLTVVVSKSFGSGWKSQTFLQNKCDILNSYPVMF